MGVFVCNCGINIGGIADVPDIVAYARTLPEVAYVQENLFSCSEDAQNQMIEVIKEYNPEPGGGGGLQPLDASADFPGYAAQCRVE